MLKVASRTVVVIVAVGASLRAREAVTVVRAVYVASRAVVVTLLAREAVTVV